VIGYDGQAPVLRRAEEREDLGAVEVEMMFEDPPAERGDESVGDIFGTSGEE